MTGLPGIPPRCIPPRPNGPQRCLHVSQLALARAYPEGGMAPTMFGFRSARSRAMEQRHQALDRTSAASTLQRARVQSYRERHGGEGHPHGLWQDHVPLPPGMFAAAHTYRPIPADCSWSNGSSHAAAVRQITLNAAAQFDPKEAEAFLPANGIGLIRDNAFRQEENEERWPTNC